MNIEELWSKYEGTVYLSYVIIATILLGVYFFIFFSFSEVDLYPIALLLLVVGSFLGRYKTKKFEKNILYIFLWSILIYMWTLEELIKNNFLILPFFLIYLYALFPFFVEYGTAKEKKARLFALAKSVGLLALFCIWSYFLYYYG